MKKACYSEYVIENVTENSSGNVSEKTEPDTFNEERKVYL